MKKNLRMLFLGLAAAAFGTGFAQENVTDKLINADLSKGVLGWDVEFTDHIWQKQTKGQASYHGFNGACIQNWKSDASSGLTNSSISQTVKGLPNGTYVFGAYLAAAKKDSVENREQVEGVYLYANDVAAQVATNWPEHTAQQWSHSAKFNVAANVTDGVLTVGIKNDATNANYIIFDNPTLYFFGDKDAETALNEMAKIDLAASVALADTCKAHVMNVDSLAELNTAIEAAKAVTGVEGAYEADENLWWAFRHARSSVSDYRGLNNSIAAAKEVAGMEWSEFVAAAVEALNALITDAEGAYTAATSVRTEINELKNSLNEAVALVQLDGVYAKIDEVDAALEDIVPGDKIGDYSAAMIFRIEELLELIGQVLGEAEANELAATVAKHRCDSLFTLVDDIFANPISFDEFPIVISRDQNTVLGDYKFMKGTVRNESDVNTYTSKLYRFQYPLTKVRFVVKETGSNGLTGDYPFFTMSSFELFDENGEEIELSESALASNACHNTLNGSPDGQGIGALVDDDPATYFHTTWGTVVNDYHYIEVTLPEGEYSAFSFAMTARGSSQNHQFPAALEIVHVSETEALLQEAVSTAKNYKISHGTVPGFYAEDPSAFYEALAEAEALIGTTVGEAAVMAAIEKLEEAQKPLADWKPIMPETGKEYRIISAGPFFAKQNVMKALSVYADTAVNNRIYWETASADSAQQVFTFEPMANDEGKDYFIVKHVATGKYIGDFLNFEGEVANSNAHGLVDTPDTVELVPLGYGQFALANGVLAGNNSNWIHAGGHSSGAGKKDYTVKWATEANNSSAWFIREMQVLPFNAKSISDLNFESTTYSIYEGVNSLTLTADKECAFADFVLYDLYGEVIPVTPSVSGATATVILDSLIESFSFSFANTEAVAAVSVNGAITKLSTLQEHYDAALAAAPIVGDQIGQVKDVAEYDAALAAAEALLANGGSDDAVVKAIADLDSAVAHLVINHPEADKEYFFISAMPAFKENHFVDMAIYAKEDAPAWTYVNTNLPTYRWKFIEGDPTSKGKRAFWLQNVGTGEYIGTSDYYSTALTMEAETANTRTYRIDAYGTNDAGISEVCLVEGRTVEANLHFNQHNGGASVSGNIVYWSSKAGTASSLRIVEAEAYLKELIDGIEDVEIADEFVAPAKKGIYDLYGRRIATPAATGIYIVDGKKRVIKK